LVVLLPFTSGQDTCELTAGFKKIKEKIIRKCPDFNMTLGVGKVCVELCDYQESYQQALKALAFTNPKNWVFLGFWQK